MTKISYIHEYLSYLRWALVNYSSISLMKVKIVEICNTIKTLCAISHFSQHDYFLNDSLTCLNELVLNAYH